MPCRADADLEPLLSTITEVRGGIVVADTEQLLTLEGLSALRRVKGSIIVRQNLKLESACFKGLQQRGSVTGLVNILNNHKPVAVPEFFEQGAGACAMHRAAVYMHLM